jgi:multidrug efflux system outer membrane protein
MLRCNVAPHLEVLDSDRQLFDSELKLTQDRANELLAVIALYRGLGGGWQTEDTPGPKTKS